MLFINCDKNKKVEISISIDEITIPSIEKKINDANFKTKNGILFYNETPYSGIVKEFYTEGILKTKSEYYKGKRQGIFLGWYPNGKQWFERFYTKGIKTGTHKGWFQNEQQMFEYQINNKGVYHGSVKDWHFNGQLAKHFNFYEGKEKGSQKMWKPNGKIRANFYTVKGERYGLIGLKNCLSVLSEKKQ
mgnify:CR=1 FL=1